MAGLVVLAACGSKKDRSEALPPAPHPAFRAVASVRLLIDRKVSRGWSDPVDQILEAWLEAAGVETVFNTDEPADATMAVWLEGERSCTDSYTETTVHRSDGTTHRSRTGCGVDIDFTVTLTAGAREFREEVAPQRVPLRGNEVDASDLMSQPSPQEAFATRVAAIMGQAFGMPLLLQVALVDARPFISESAVHALADRGSEAVDFLIECVKRTPKHNNARRVQRTCISSLGRIGDARAIEPLISLLSRIEHAEDDVHSDERLQAPIQDALGQLTHLPPPRSARQWRAAELPDR